MEKCLINDLHVLRDVMTMRSQCLILNFITNLWGDISAVFQDSCNTYDMKEVKQNKTLLVLLMIQK